MTRPELLAPAGTPVKLQWAAAYGADAVYFGSEFGSLRNYAGNFSDDQAAEGIGYLHRLGKKAYLTLNIYPDTDEYDQVRRTAGAFDDMGIDAIIVADLGVLHELRRLGLKAAVHISTQANTTSSAAAAAYAELGASRVNLARELSLEQIRRIQGDLAGRIETEVFVHGALCFSYSGRCAISDYMTGYRANRGECKHPCRYRYALVEEKRPGRYYPVFEDERGLYLFNCRDLALFEYLPALAEAGVTSVKIEGRMKSIHYIASVVSLYRRILDGEPIDRETAMTLLGRIPNRGYTCGFIKGSFTPDDYAFDQSVSQGSSRFVANVAGNPAPNRTLLQVRNPITAGETLEMLNPDGKLTEFTLPELLTTPDGQSLYEAKNQQQILLDTPLPPYTILRRVGRAKT